MLPTTTFFLLISSTLLSVLSSLIADPYTPRQATRASIVNKLKRNPTRAGARRQLPSGVAPDTTLSIFVPANSPNTAFAGLFIGDETNPTAGNPDNRGTYRINPDGTLVPVSSVYPWDPYAIITAEPTTATTDVGFANPPGGPNSSGSRQLICTVTDVLSCSDGISDRRIGVNDAGRLVFGYDVAPVVVEFPVYAIYV